MAELGKSIFACFYSFRFSSVKDIRSRNNNSGKRFVVTVLFFSCDCDCVPLLRYNWTQLNDIAAIHCSLFNGIESMYAKPFYRQLQRQIDNYNISILCNSLKSIDHNHGLWVFTSLSLSHSLSYSFSIRDSSEFHSFYYKHVKWVV